MSLDDKVQEEYDERFSEFETDRLREWGIEPKIANQYKRFTAFEINIIIKNKIPLKQIERYSHRLNGFDIIELIKKEITPEQEKKYHPRFDHISGFIENGISPEDANEYHLVFTGEDIIELRKVNCSAKKAEEYIERMVLIDPEFIGREIAILYRVGVEPKHLHRLNQENYRPFIEMIHELHKLNLLNNEVSLLGVGNQAIVLLNEETGKARKFLKTNNGAINEYLLLQKVHKNQNIKNIIGLVESEILTWIPNWQDIELEYIKGKSLEESINNNSANKQKILKYSANILNGLQELRQAGIYQHRDIRPANIMIDEENDRAVIIDLGIATTNPLAPPKDNRRYGGPNDLISLGQVVYKMATGEHIFAESESMERTVYADQLKDHRDWIYEDDERLEPYLRKVEEIVEDEKIAGIIKLCLTAKGTEEDYQRLEERFAEVLT